MAQRRRPSEQRAWLAGDPPLAEVRAAFPAEWAQVQRELAAVVESDDVGAVQAYAARIAQPAAARDERAAVSALARQRLAAAALRQMGVAAATGVASGTLRFGLVSGWLTQRLLFAGSGLERKPVSMAAFRLVWPLVRQKSYLMPLVEPRGIYCFYSKALVNALAERISDRSCVEIAAGDGTLARFLRAAGTDVVATDDYSWQKTRKGAAQSDVIQQDAQAALRERAPQVVLCSWPPAGNPFEKWVFKTPSVETYIMIGSRSEQAAGNFADYRAQTAFSMQRDDALSKLVLPPEAEPAVYVFERSERAQA
ncbi:SAM-dependent methyltransferase [Baekduia sp. Peel2402]|uniref:SAM-dependent methyltransferase n=1 Tax=Baekduia sp. Peel2402 TaxID=3458296 RepID=UPI00403E74FE